MFVLKPKSIFIPTLLLAVLIISGCSGSGSDNSATSSSVPTATATGSASSSKTSVTTSSSSSSSSRSATSASSSSSSSAQSTSANGVTLNWKAPARNTDGSMANDIKGYVVHYGTDSANLDQRLVINSHTQLSAAIPGLVRGKTYYLAVASINSLDVESELSDIVAVKA